MTDIFIPTIFLKSFPGLEPVEHLDELSFARLIVTSYFFCRQSLPDLFYEFFAILRRNTNVPITVKVGYVNLRQVGLLLLEDIEDCGTKKYLMRALKKVPDQEDTTLEKIIRLGTKYPLLFFTLQRYRHHYQRFVFGDKFWGQAKHHKSLRVQTIEWESDEEAANVSQLQSWFESETTARQQTALVIMQDLLNENVNPYQLVEEFYEPSLHMGEDEMTILKEQIGYVLGRKLLLESNIPLNPKSIFLQPFITTATSTGNVINQIMSVAGPYGVRELKDALAPHVLPDRVPGSPQRQKRDLFSPPGSPTKQVQPPAPPPSLVDEWTKKVTSALPANMLAVPLGRFNGAMTGTLPLDGEEEKAADEKVEENNQLDKLEDVGTIPVADDGTMLAIPQITKAPLNNSTSMLAAVRAESKSWKKEENEEEEQEENAIRAMAETEVDGEDGGGGAREAGEGEEEKEGGEDEDGEEYDDDELPPPMFLPKNDGNVEAVLKLEDNVLIRDKAMTKRDFVYSTITGRSRWVRLFEDEHGNIVQRFVGY